MTTLKEIWDQGLQGRCAKWEHYFEIYERYLSKFKGQDITYLEIGVQQGGSLDLIKKYFGEQVKTVGIDVDQSCEAIQDRGHRIFIGDQSNKDFLKTVVDEIGHFDIIIDDGGHTSGQQITSFNSLFPHLKYGGVYLVEDLHCSQYWVGYQDSELGINFLDYAKGLADKLSLYHMREDWFHHRYGVSLEHRGGGHIRYNNFAVNDIFSISFFDSIIAIEKRKMTEPFQTRK